MRSLKESEYTRFFDFARSLPENDFWGKKARYLHGDFERFKEFLNYIKPFEPKCFLVAEEDKRFVGFLVAAYNPDWVRELSERYGYNVRKRADILGVAVAKGRQDVFETLVRRMMDCLHQKGIPDAEYPTLGDVCLTTGTDILTPENVVALILFRKAGFKISDCYYSMKLSIDARTHRNEVSIEKAMFRSKERGVEIIDGNDILGSIAWEPIENGKTSIGNVYVAPTHRKKGLGTALLEKALKRLETESVKEIELGVDGHNLAALRLYKKFGFTVSKTHLYIVVSFESMPNGKQGS